jgi:hypothetical protein
MSLNFPKTGSGKGRPLRAQLWRNDATVDYSPGDEIEHGRGDRAAITEFSKASLKQLCFVAHNTAVRFQLMATLTYPKQWKTDGKEVKRHLYEWLRWAKRTCKVEAYLWALEFQGRGAPHYHVFTYGGVLEGSKKACSLAWYEIVDSGDPKHLLAGTKVERLRKPDAAGRYAAKYAGKTWQKAVPVGYRDVGRFWGNSYNVKPEPIVECNLDGWGDLITTFEDWEYVERLEKRKPISVLYNASKCFTGELKNE